MTLKSNMLEDVNRVFLNPTEHAESIQYIPFNGTRISLNAILDPSEETQSFPMADGLVILVRGKLYLKTSAIPLPQEGDRVELTYQTVDRTIELQYKVLGGHRDGAGMTELDIQIIDQVEKSSQGYRINKITR